MPPLWPQVRACFTDPRFHANLVTFYGFAILLLLGSLIVRRLLGRCCPSEQNVQEWTWTQRCSFHLVHWSRRVVFWITFVGILATTAAGTIYHLVGHDIRHEMRWLYRELDIRQLYQIGMIVASLAGLCLVTELTVWLVRRLCPQLHKQAHCTVGCAANDASLRSWFELIESYAVIAVRLAATWEVGILLGLEHTAGQVCGFLLRLLTIVVAVRLVTLSIRTLARKGIDLGNKYLSAGPKHRYWECFARLLPFGERCLEVAVYITAVALCLHLVRSLTFLADSVRVSFTASASFSSRGC